MSLTATEQKVLTCLRRAYARPLFLVSLNEPAAPETQLTTTLAELVVSLRKVDPFVLRVRKVGMPPTVFELQVVHLVNLTRSGEREARDAVLNWLFPESEIPHATSIMNSANRALNESFEDERTASPCMLRERMVALIARGVRHGH